MFSAFFGNYLLSKKVVTSQELSRVLENQKQIRLKLGVLAVNSGFMTSEQVNEIHQLQYQYDRRFGDLAIEKGYINEEVLMTLLAQQKAEHLLLAQALIDDNILSMDEFEHEINAYKHDYELTDEEFDALKDENVEAIIKAFANFETSFEANLYGEFLSIFIKNIIRFVDSHVHIDRLIKVPSIEYDHLFSQTVIGDQGFFTGFAGTFDAILLIASKHAEEEFDELDDYAIDSAGEFLNLSNGIFVVNKSNQGYDIQLSIQQHRSNCECKPKGNLYRIPIYIEDKTIDLIIGDM